MSIANAVINTNQAQVLSEFTKSILMSDKRIAIEKERQKEIYEDASEALKDQGLKPAEVKKILRSCLNPDKAEESSAEAEALASIARMVSEQ